MAFYGLLDRYRVRFQNARGKRDQRTFDSPEDALDFKARVRRTRRFDLRSPRRHALAWRGLRRGATGLVLGDCLAQGLLEGSGLDVEQLHTR